MDRATYVNRDLGQTQPLATAGLFIEEADDLDIDVHWLAARGKDSTEHGVNLRRCWQKH